MRFHLVLCIVAFLISPATGIDYSDYGTMVELLSEKQARYRHIMTLESIAKSPGGRDVHVVTLATGDAGAHPAVLVVGNVEGVDIVASEMCLRFIDEVLSGFGKVDSITRLLEKATLYILPRVNPDASETFFSTPRFESRLNAMDLDLDRDGFISEDGPEDLNGDGFISRMRVKDPLGEWIADENVPRLMRKANRSKGETGRYRIYIEGFDNDGDGLFNEDPAGGVDFNRNFTYNYKYFDAGSGVYQLSEAESRGIADFCYEHPNIVLFFSFSHNSNLLKPWQAVPEKKNSTGKNDNAPGDRFISRVLSGDAPYYNYLSEKFGEITGLDDGPESRRGDGAFSEWAYFHFGRMSLSVPVWWPPPVEQSVDSSETDSTSRGSTERSLKNGAGEKSDPLKYEKRMLDWLHRTGREEEFIDWQAVEHPDFPDQNVEIGGFFPHIAVNPPADSLPVLARIHSRYLLFLAGSIPQLDLVPKVERLHDNVYRLTAVIRNLGYLPTNTELGSRLRWIRKVKAGLELGENAELLSGRKYTLFESLAGSGGSAEVTWLIRGKKGVTIEIYAGCPMTGEKTVKITLK